MKNVQVPPGLFTLYFFLLRYFQNFSFVGFIDYTKKLKVSFQHVEF